MFRNVSNLFSQSKHLLQLFKKENVLRRQIQLALIPTFSYFNKHRKSEVSQGIGSLKSRSYFTTSLFWKEKRNLNDANPPELTSKIVTIPNVLTLARLGISPYIGYLVLAQDFHLALTLFCVAGVSDMVDGWIARNVKGQGSIFGSFIDPLADKVLISILTVTLAITNIIPGWLCGLIVIRDVMLVTTSSHFHYKNLEAPKTLRKFFDFENSKVKMEPTQISKYNTFLQLGLVAISLAIPVLELPFNNLLAAYWYWIFGFAGRRSHFCVFRLAATNCLFDYIVAIGYPLIRTHILN